MAVVVAVVAGVGSSRSHGHRSKVVAFAASAFLVGSFLGGWIAPSIHPAGWSSGSAHVELRGALSRTKTLAVDCSSVLDGALLSISGGMPTGNQMVASDSLRLSLTIAAEVPLSCGLVPASTGFYLDVGTGQPGNGQEFSYNPEAGITTISGQGTPGSGQVTFEKLPVLVNGDPSLTNDLPTRSGVIDWTCQPAHDAPTPVEGSWFH